MRVSYMKPNIKNDRGTCMLVVWVTAKIYVQDFDPQLTSQWNIHSIFILFFCVSHLFFICYCDLAAVRHSEFVVQEHVQTGD